MSNPEPAVTEASIHHRKPRHVGAPDVDVAEPLAEVIHAGEWTWLYDDYDAGTVFITDDPEGSQVPIADGLTTQQATDIVEAHHKTVAALAEPVVTEVLRAADRLANTVEMMLHWTSVDDEAHRSWLPSARADMKRELGAYRTAVLRAVPTNEWARAMEDPDEHRRAPSSARAAPSSPASPPKESRSDNPDRADPSLPSL